MLSSDEDHDAAMICHKALSPSCDRCRYRYYMVDTASCWRGRVLKVLVVTVCVLACMLMQQVQKSGMIAWAFGEKMVGARL